MGDEGDGGGAENALVDDNGSVLVVLAVLVVRGGNDGRGNQGQCGEEGGGDAHCWMEEVRCWREDKE